MMNPQHSTEATFKILDEKVRIYAATCGNCAQTTFLSLQEVFELDDGAILKALTPFPGLALRGETCGVVTGCLMALGLVFGRDRENLNDWSAYLASLSPARKFCRAFEKELGSTLCGDIIEAEFGKRYNLADPAESMEWMSSGALDKCGAVVGKGVRIAAEILLISPTFSQGS